MIRILRTSSREKDDLLPKRIAELNGRGMKVLYDNQPANPNWTYSAADPLDRATALANALAELSTRAVVCARGGYGASDLLHLLDWRLLGRLPEKFLVGFSDSSALHSALYTQLGWRGIHGPMPATILWNKDGETRDTEILLALIEGQISGSQIDVEPVLSTGNPTPPKNSITGILFGGCFSVLTNLIGTPYLPKSLSGHVLFFEDLDEHPARLMRHWNQWLQAGLLEGVKAVVIGNLLKLGQGIPDNAPYVFDEWAKRCPAPVFKSTAFGHLSPNFPLGVGAVVEISKKSSSANATQWSLKWNFVKDQPSIS